MRNSSIIMYTTEDILTPIGTNFVCKAAGVKFLPFLPVFQAVFDVVFFAACTAISSAVGILTMPT